MYFHDTATKLQVQRQFQGGVAQRKAAAPFARNTRRAGKFQVFFGVATLALSEFGLRLMLRYAAQGTEGGRGGIRCPLSRCPNHTNLRKIKNVGLFN